MFVHVLNGVSFGCILFLLAAGLCLMFGLMRIVNLAHGSYYLLGGYVAYSVGKWTGNFGLGILAAIVCIAGIGFAMERGLLRYLRGQALEQVLLTFGLVYIFTDIARTVWGGYTAFPATFAMLEKPVRFLGITYPGYRLALIGIGAVLALALWLFQEKTKLGAIVRAAVDDEEMVRGLGINAGLISTAVFTLGAALAGFAGAMGSVFTGAYLGVDIEVLVLALIVVVIGGLGSLPGAMAAALLIGLADSFGKALIPELAYFTIFGVMALVLVFRPTGLLGRGS